MNVRRVLAIASLLGAASALSGCVVEVDFSPLGSDVSLATTGEWTINGGAATAASCDAAGIDQVRLVFYDNGSMYDFGDLTFPCEQGSFDSRPDAILAWGSYETRWQAISGGTVIAEGNMLPLVVNSPTTHANLAPPDFVVTSNPGFTPKGDHAAVSATWTINGEAANDTNCGAAGIATIAIVFMDGDMAFDDVDRDFYFDCGDGAYMSSGPVLGNDRYDVVWTAYDAAGNSLGMTVPAIIDTTALTPGARVNLAPIDFVVTPSYGDAVIQLAWEAHMGDMDYDTCDVAKVTDFNFTLTNADNEVIEMQTSGTGAVECAPTLTIAESCDEYDDPCYEQNLEPGNYELYIEGYDNGTKHWMMTCDMYMVVGGDFADVDCFVDKSS